MFDYRSSSTFNYFSDLNPERRDLINRLQQTIEEGDNLEELFGVQGTHLEEAIEVNRNVYKAPLMSALDRYSPGILYKSMDFAGLPTGAQRRLLENAVIFSGLFGLLRPDDLVPNYRLRMDAVLPEIGKVSSYWKEHLSGVLNKTIEGHVVWNMLPQIHRDAWEDEHAYDQMIEILFFDEQGGERSAVTHGVKPLRGQVVNYVVKEMIEEVDDLEGWSHPAGYEFDDEATVRDEATKTTRLVMVKKL